MDNRFTDFDVAVVGGGPAGTRAALAAATSGLRVALFDENREAGGQVYRAPIDGIAEHRSADHRMGEAMRRELAASTVTSFFSHAVWAVTADYRIDAMGPSGPASCTARALIVASGATERVVPFPGWTTPGVIGLAAATVLLKSHGRLPGRSTLVAGRGPLLAAVAARTIEGGGHVSAIADHAGTAEWAKALPAMAARPDLLVQGLKWWRTIRRASTPTFARHVVMRVEPEGEQLRATLARCAADGRPLPEEPMSLLVDCVVVGHGLTPSTEITRLLRAEHRYSSVAGGWIVVADRDGRTSRARLYVAGDAAGIAGADAAAIHGTLAGLACASDLGGAESGPLRRSIPVLRRRHRRAARFGRTMAKLMAMSPAQVDAIIPETIVCRCEDVTRGDIDAAYEAGARHMNQLKAWTRCGMGPCQGRSCADVAAELLRLRVGAAATRESVGCFTARTPLRPVRLAALTGTYEYADIGIPEAAPS